MSKTVLDQRTGRTFFCDKADTHRLTACVRQCDRCLKADFDEGLDADEWRGNMERECKP